MVADRSLLGRGVGTQLVSCETSLRLGGQRLAGVWVHSVGKLGQAGWPPNSGIGFPDLGSHRCPSVSRQCNPEGAYQLGKVGASNTRTSVRRNHDFTRSELCDDLLSGAE
jgi:hypothetical protein